MSNNDWNPNAPDVGGIFNNAAPDQERYNIYFRAIDFDMHEDRLVEAITGQEGLDRNIDQFWHNAIGNRPGFLA